MKRVITDECVKEIVASIETGKIGPLFKGVCRLAKVQLPKIKKVVEPKAGKKRK